MEKLKFLLCFILLGAISCSYNEEVVTPEENPNHGFPSSTELCFVVSDTARVIESESKALDIANRFSDNFGFKARATTESSVTTVYQDNGTPAMYVINYGEDDGFVIVSAVKDTEPILAYSDTGSFNIEGIDGSPVEGWLEDAKLYVEYSPSLPDSVKLGYARQWEKFTNQKEHISKLKSRGWDNPEELSRVYEALEYYYNQGYEIKENPTPDVHIYTYTLNQALGSLSDQKDIDGYSQREKSFLLTKTTQSSGAGTVMLTTAWDQGQPYNGKILAIHGKYVPLGCVTIAIGQLMKYYRKPAGDFQFDKMPDKLTNFSSDQEYTVLTDFLYHIGKEWLGIDYENGNSGSTIYKAAEVLKSHGFPKAKIIEYDFQTIKSYLNKGPVYLRASSTGASVGHAWVCDGYKLTTWEGEYLLITYNGLYMDATPAACFDTIYSEWEPRGYSEALHMNWGWGGLHNGFFVYNNWDISNEDFAVGRKAIVELN